MFITPNADSQTIIGIYNYANNCMIRGDYEQSIIEFERILFFTDTLNKECYLKLADCYTKLSNYEIASNYYHKAYNSELDDSLKNEILFKNIIHSLQHNKPIYALIDLNLINTGTSAYFIKKKLFFLVATYYLLDNYDQSLESILALSGYYPESDSNYIKSIFDKAKKNKARKTGYLPLFSAIILGSGQFTGGNYKEGVDSFVLNTILLSIAIVSINRLSYLDAFLSLFSPLRRYYISGINKTKILADKKKEERNIELYNQLLEYSYQKMSSD